MSQKTLFSDSPLEGDFMKKEEINVNNSIFLIFNWKLKKSYEIMFQKASHELNLTQSEIDVLLFLSNNRQFDTASEIVRYRVMSKSMISKSVDSLHRKGLIYYVVDEDDKRCTHLKLESEALPTVKKLQELQKDFFEILTHDISEEEYRAMKTALEKMHRNISGKFD